MTSILENSNTITVENNTNNNGEDNKEEENTNTNGVKVTINTDNMTVSRTTLQKEYDIFKELCIKSSLSNEETEKLVIQIQKNAIEASYMSDLKKQQYISQIVNTSIGDDILGN